jgi:hypothetical protein
VDGLIECLECNNDMTKIERKIERSNNVGKEFSKTYSCEICKSQTVPTLEIAEAEKHNAAVGAFIIRRHEITDKETRRSVVCYQCIRKTDEKSFYTENERAFIQFVGPEDLYD